MSILETKTRTRNGTPPTGPAGADGSRTAPHPLRSELRRGFAPWAGLAVAATLSITMAGKAPQWQGSWGETQTMLHLVSALLGGPLAAAAGCWHGGRERRRRTDELRASAARGPLAQFLTASLPVAAWIAVAYAVVAVGVGAATWPYASASRPLLSPALADAAFLVAMTVLGHVVGRLVAWWPAAPALAVCGYLVLGVPTYATSGFRHLSPASAPETDSVLPVWWQPLAESVWVGGLAAAAVLAYAASRKYIALLPLTAAAVAAVLIGQTGDRMWRDHPLAHQQVCDTSVRPQICVNALYPAMLPEVGAALSGLTDRLEGVENLPVRFEDRAGEPRPNEAQLPMLTPTGQSMVRSRLTDPEQYAWEAASALTSGDRCAARILDKRASQVDDAVTEWLAPNRIRNEIERQHLRSALESGDDKMQAGIRADRAARARLASMDTDERRAWLSRYFATADSCDPKRVPAL
ncbi:hypothetical protein OHS70_11895 [Streptomyces sp. NBC_00390]|uniref:hypothetical protein n=1 Tax=Streptomyces sp. NBC_00390 TaxID=2975736 RepID=UPI002E200F2E